MTFVAKKGHFMKVTKKNIEDLTSLAFQPLHDPMYELLGFNPTYPPPQTFLSNYAIPWDIQIKFFKFKVVVRACHGVYFVCAYFLSLYLSNVLRTLIG